MTGDDRASRAPRRAEGGAPGGLRRAASGRRPPAGGPSTPLPRGVRSPAGAAGSAPPTPSAWRDRASLPFLAAIVLSAFLLFTLELLAGRRVLPVFGGTPGVWATTLSFFTAILFAGYLYAHLVATRLDPGRGGVVHLAVAATAVAATVLAPSEIAALRQPDLPEALNVVLVQAITAGPAAFLLAATTPLLSAWYGRRGHDPWWLYAASNGASFAALLAYPFVIEPLIGQAAQRVLLGVGLAIFAATLGAIAWPSRRAAVRDGGGTSAETLAIARETTSILAAGATRPAGRTTFRRRAIWLLAALVPAGLLSATTNFVTTDLLSAPLLWIGPLGIYLLSFVVAFSARGGRIVQVAELVAPAAAVMLWLPWIAPVDWPAATLLAVELGAFLVLAVVIHGRLARDRPGAAELTGFYLVMSAGGMLATAFVALVAPVVFPAIYEYPLLVLAAIAVLELLPGPRRVPLRWRPVPLLRAAAGRLAPFAAAAVLLLVLVAATNELKLMAVLQMFVIGALVLAIGIRPGALAGASLVAILLLANAYRTGLIHEERTFFGVLRIRANEDARAEMSGTTLHGFQFLAAEKQQVPTTYYVADGPLGQLIQDTRDRAPNLRLGVVGLGVGTMAAYARPGDELTFYEIDAAAVRIAKDPALFTYLSGSHVEPRIVLGDARLSLQREPPGLFDLLVLDAFSSDAVPTHLLTMEAIAEYVRTLRPGGILAFHVTNRYYRLESAVIATAQASGLGALVKRYFPTDEGRGDRAATASVWVVVGTRAEMPRYRGLGWGDTSPGPVLTDDFADLLRVFRLLG